MLPKDRSLDLCQKVFSSKLGAMMSVFDVHLTDVVLQTSLTSLNLPCASKQVINLNFERSIFAEKI